MTSEVAREDLLLEGVFHPVQTEFHSVQTVFDLGQGQEYDIVFNSLGIGHAQFNLLFVLETNRINSAFKEFPVSFFPVNPSYAMRRGAILCK